MADAKHTETPWRVVMDSIFAGEMRVCDVRGWGYLTGQGSGALGLSAREAEAIQKANAALIVTAVNERSALLKCEEALRDMVIYFDGTRDEQERLLADFTGQDGPQSMSWPELGVHVKFNANSALSLLEEVRSHGK